MQDKPVTAVDLDSYQSMFIYNQAKLQTESKLKSTEISKIYIKTIMLVNSAINGLYRLANLHRNLETPGRNQPPTVNQQLVGTK
jgi:hypothetical protein